MSMLNMEKIRELDSHWSEVMELAVKYGFFRQAERRNCKGRRGK